MSEKKEFEPLDVGATERVDWKVAQGLNKYIHFDENGNAVIGKNLEIGGATKLNGGFKPIHSYVLMDSEGINYPFDVYVELPSGGNQFSFFGKYSDSLCYGIYALENGKVNEVRLMYLNDPSENPYILHADNFSGNSTTNQPIQTLP